MPEENLSTAVPVKVKKTRKSAKGGAVKKKKTVKPAFAAAGDLPIKPAMPKADFKIMDSPPDLSLKEPTRLPDGQAANRGQAKTIYRKLAFSFVALTAALVGLVFYFGFSRMTLVIVPVQERVSDSAVFEIADQAFNSASGRSQITGIVRQVAVERSKTFAAGGKQVLGQEVTGKVTIINNYIKNQPLVATTRLLAADNKLFRLKNTVNVPAGGKAEAEVYADEARPELAIGPAKFTIPGLWAGIQDKIYAQSSAAMKYSEKAKYVIEQSDVDSAVKELREELLASAKQTVSQAYKDYDRSLLEVDDNSVSQELNGKVGEEKQNFSLKMKVMVTVVAFKDDEVYSQAKSKLAVSLADDKEIAEFNKQDLIYALDNVNLSQGLAQVKATASAKVTLKDSARIIKKNNLAGLKLDQLKTYLDGLPEVAGYEIKFFPSFIKKVPKLADRIEIVIKK